MPAVTVSAIGGRRRVAVPDRPTLAAPTMRTSSRSRTRRWVAQRVRATYAMGSATHRSTTFPCQAARSGIELIAIEPLDPGAVYMPNAR